MSESVKHETSRKTVVEYALEIGGAGSAKGCRHCARCYWLTVPPILPPAVREMTLVRHVEKVSASVIRYVYQCGSAVAL
jgi:hypothetical protein